MLPLDMEAGWVMTLRESGASMETANGFYSFSFV